MRPKVLLTATETNLWAQLQALSRIDPTISGGIESMVYGRRAITREAPMGMLPNSGYEEIYEIDPGFCLYVADAHLDQDWRLTAKSRDHTLRLRVTFAGEAGYVSRESRLSDAASRCTFIIRPPGEALTSNFQGGVTYRYCSISVNQHYLRKSLGLSDDELPHTLIQHWAKRETVLGQFLASKASLTHASRFFNIRLTPGWHNVAIRALALELLRLLLQDWQGTHPEVRTSVRITPAEHAKLVKLRAQIAADPAAPLTLAKLCSQLRTSRNKLHTGFKQSFGISIHDYQTELRMRKALTLLETTDLPVAEIADQTGYGEPTNFTAAFKKYFAILPREARKGRTPG